MQQYREREAANQGLKARKWKKLIASAQILSQNRDKTKESTSDTIKNVAFFVFEKCGKDWSRAKCSLWRGNGVDKRVGGGCTANDLETLLHPNNSHQRLFNTSQHQVHRGEIFEVGFQGWSVWWCENKFLLSMLWLCMCCLQLKMQNFGESGQEWGV